MGRPSIAFERLPAHIRRGDSGRYNVDRQRIYVKWYGRTRWLYLHARWHRCLTKRVDGYNRYFWLAIGPFDLRIHV